MAELAYTIGLYSIPHYAVAGIGLSQTQGAAIQSILSAGQLTGRPLCGLLLDRIGRINGAAIVTVRLGAVARSDARAGLRWPVVPRRSTSSRPS